MYALPNLRKIINNSIQMNFIRRIIFNVKSKILFIFQKKSGIVGEGEQKEKLMFSILHKRKKSLALKNKYINMHINLYN